MTSTLQRVRFPAGGPDPPVLEGELWVPDGVGSVAGAVVCHPHPLRGGSMDSNVVMAICNGLQRADIAWLRFNFRGVGLSEGRYGGGDDEPLDVLGALAFVAKQPRVDPNRVGLAGYSFGARVSLTTAAKAPHVRALLCVAPPLRGPLPVEQHPVCPLMALVGDQDGLTADGVDRYASYFPDAKQLHVVRGTDHFWWGFEPVLTDTAARFFAGALTLE